MRDYDPLEVIAIAARESAYRDPRNPPGTKSAAITYADICGSLGMCADKFGADLALMIGTQNWRNLNAVQTWLTHCVVQRANERGMVPDLVAVANAVDEAVTAAVAGTARRPGGSKWFRWAYAEIMARAQNAAFEAIERLWRWKYRAA